MGVAKKMTTRLAFIASCLEYQLATKGFQLINHFAAAPDLVCQSFNMCFHNLDYLDVVRVEARFKYGHPGHCCEYNVSNENMPKFVALIVDWLNPEYYEIDRLEYT